MAPPATAKYDWLLALISIAFCASAFGNGANDVANSYATSVAARTLTMPQVGFLSMCTEFIGAVALGSRVTDTIKNDIIDLERFSDPPKPGALMLVMTCAEFGSTTWLIFATALGFPVSTTQTIVGALVGAGLASGAQVTWNWEKGSVTQVAASWAIAPCLAAAFAAVLFATLKFAVLERTDSFKWAMRLIPFYLSLTGALLALFITIEAPDDYFATFGAGKAAGIILGVFGAMLVISYVFFVPYFKARVVRNDSRVKWWHLPLGPLLLRENPPLYLPGKGDAVIDYYATAYDGAPVVPFHPDSGDASSLEKGHAEGKTDTAETTGAQMNTESPDAQGLRHRKAPEPEERWLHPVKHLPIFHPQKLWNWTKFAFLQGVSRDCVTYDSAHLEKTHALAIKYDNRVEHLWTYCQVASAMMMSIAHGSNDVANAVGPWVATYNTYRAGEVDSESDTPIWILCIAGFLLGAGFWFMGFTIIRALGNRITRVSPTRGFSIELGAAITVLLASRLALPVSTTQCLAGATVGVALMNFQIGAVNWRQMLFILSGWIMTLPAAGLIAGLLTLIGLNTPHL